MIDQKAIDSTLEIWKTALKGKDGEELNPDGKETLEYMIDAVTNTKRLHKELERFKQQNVSLVQINDSIFRIVKQWLNVLENTPVDALKDKYTNLHLQRANTVENQTIQKMIWNK